MATHVSLHTHEASASADAVTPVREMAHAAAEAGIDLVGFVGHDERPQVPDDLPVETMTGTEIEVRRRPKRLHVLDFPDQDLRILAHPAWSVPKGKNVEEWTRRAVGALDVDAVELFNRGQEEYDRKADVGVPAVAGDDAHNSAQVATSYMVVESPAEPQAVADAVKRGKVELVNAPASRRRYARGRLLQGLGMLEGWLR